MHPRYRRAISTGTFVLSTFLLVVAGCRDESAPVTVQPPIPFHMQFTVGSTFLYQVRLVDPSGFFIQDSTEEHHWNVVAVGRQTRGRTGITVVADSVTGAGQGSARLDTLFFQFNDNGDVFAYGFLSSIVRRSSGAVLPPQWDRIAVFALGTDASWTAGVIDPPADSAYGLLTTGQDLVSVVVDGANRIFPAYHIQISGGDLLIDLWAADAPSAFSGVDVAPGESSNGMIQELLSAHIAGP